VKLSFRQGIVKHQTDANGNPIFLQNGSGQFIDLVVSPDTTVVSFAHRSSTYLIEEVKTVKNAWGPITGTGTKYLYWDVNLLNGEVTRGVTLLPPIYTSSAPTSPLPDQYWFDTVENVSRVWNGAKWVEKIRAFAGYITSNSIIKAARIGSEAGITGTFDAGFLVLDSFGMPLRQSDGSLLTTVASMKIVNLGTTTARLEQPLMSAMAAEEIPMYSLVQLKRGRKMVLARSTDYTTRVAGIVASDMYEGEVDNIITTGVVKNQNWSFTDDQISKPVFCGPTGQVSITPPTQGVNQIIGFVYDTDSIFMSIKPVVVLDVPTVITPPPPPPPVAAPIANFYGDVMTGVAPFTVQFTDTSTGAEFREWDFTNDGYVDSTDTNPSYTFAAAGLYTVRLRVTNSFGADEEIKANYITVTAPQQSTEVNVGVSFGAPVNVSGGQAFSFQVITSNAGGIQATNVVRVLKLRTNNTTPVTILNPPAGVTVETQGVLTVVTLPTTVVAGGGTDVIVLQASAAATAGTILITGTVSCAETDNTPQDNSASLSITVTP
jgi:PKD repeat protein